MSEREPVATPRFRADAARGVTRSSRIALLVSAITLVIGQACYHYRAVPVQPITEDEPGGAPAAATEYESETVWALAWGLVQERPDIDNCEGQGLAEVRVTTNLGYALLTIATLGFASPARVEWKCAKATPSPEPIGAANVDAPMPWRAASGRRARRAPGRSAESVVRSTTVLGITNGSRSSQHPRAGVGGAP